MTAPPTRKCGRAGCTDPRPHVHLRWQDEHAIARVLLKAHFRRRARARMRREK